MRDRQDSIKPGEKPPRNVGRRSDDSNRKRVAARTTKRAASLDKPASRKKPPTPGSRRETASASGLSAPSKRTEVADGGRKRLTRVRVGGRAIPRERAERTVASLRSEGFSPALLPDGKGFVVQVGAFRDRKGAEAVADQLRSKGFFPSLR